MLDGATLTMNTTACDRIASGRHCIFRCGATWYSIPAITVQEVAVSAQPVRLPGSPAWLLGIVHRNSEFIPVVSLVDFLGNTETDVEDDQNFGDYLLLVIGGNQPWAIRISQVLSIAEIDATLAPPAQSHGTRQRGIVGTFTLGQHVARILEPHHLLQQIQLVLKDN